MTKLFVKSNKELTLIGGGTSFVISLLVAGVLAILFSAVRAAFDAVPIWVIAVSFTLLTVGVFISHRLNNWRWVMLAVLCWMLSSFAYLLGVSSSTNYDTAAVWDFSGLRVMLLSGSMLLGSAASVLMPLVLRSIQNEKLFINQTETLRITENDVPL